MADDRVFIKCKVCGGWKMLLKFYSSTGLSSRDNGVLDWLSDHSDCHELDGYSNLSGDPRFTLHTEGDIGYSLDPSLQNFIPR